MVSNKQKRLIGIRFAKKYKLDYRKVWDTVKEIRDVYDDDEFEIQLYRRFGL